MNPHEEQPIPSGENPPDPSSEIPEENLEEGKKKKSPEPGSKEWLASFENLPEISSEEAMVSIQSGKPMSGYKIPLLNLDGLTLENPVAFEKCILPVFQAKGAVFLQKLSFRNCYFQGNLEMAPLQKEKEETSQKTTLKEGMDVFGCLLERSWYLRESEILGEIYISKSVFLGSVFMDNCHSTQDVIFSGPGKISLLSLVRSNLEKNLSVQKYDFSGSKKNSIDLRGLRAQGVFISNCHLEQPLELSKSRLGVAFKKALEIENCTLQKVFLYEIVGQGNIQFTQVKITEEIMAEPTRSEHGKKSGRTFQWDGDIAFLDCQFGGKISFHEATFRRYVNFKRCQIQQGANFKQSEFGGLLSFWECQSVEGFQFHKSQFHGRVSFGKTAIGMKTAFNEATFEDLMTIFDSQVDGDVFFTGARFQKDFKLNKVVFKGGLGLKEISCEGDLSMVQCSIRDRLILSQGEIQGIFYAPGLSVGTWAGMEHCTFRGDVTLSGCQIGSSLPENVSTPVEDLKEDVSEKPTEPKEEGKGKKEEHSKEEVIPGSFYLDFSTFYDSLKLLESRIRGKISLDNVNGYGEMELLRMKIGHDLTLSESYFRSMVRCGGNTIRGNLRSNKSRYKEEVSFNGNTCRNISLSSSSFDGGFTLRSCKIEGTLSLNNTDVDGKADLSKTEWKRIFFNNFLSDHFIFSRESLGDKISSEMEKNYTQASHEYGVLQRAFLQRSMYRDMDWAYYRFCKNNRKAKGLFLLRPFHNLAVFFEWVFLDLGFGYGTRPMNIGGVALAIVLIFGAIFYAVPQGIVRGSGEPFQQISPENAVYLSVMAFVSMDYGNVEPRFDHWLKFFFSLEGVLGIFLVTLFVATVSRKIIRT